ncbi:gastrotropin-like [Phyllopteryx taeniolatus]|uniref:gastrotropin-like n=1 Tax=Phyllopteryx taeniolatus TaxID=161469 RepID=UPI002AD32350|nr:gastrotropin-like [Phyllopteryx taeniolatus]
MSLNGKYVLESHENYNEFLQALGMSKVEVVNEDMVTDIYQGAYYRIAKFMGGDVLTNTFMPGKEAELEDLDGTTFMTTVNLEGGKIKIQFPKYVYTAEVSGDKLIEINSFPDGVTNKMVSRKLLD